MFLNCKKRNAVSFAALLCCSHVAFSATVKNIHNESPSVLSGFVFESKKQEQTISMGAQKENSLLEVKRNKDKLGNQHIRYQQYHNNLPVYGKQVIVHNKKNKYSIANTQTVSGQLVQNIAADKTMNPADAQDPKLILNQIKKQYQAQAGLSNISLLYKNQKAALVYFVDANEQASLAYAISFFVDASEGGKPARPHFIVDAKTGDVLQHWDGLMHQAATAKKLGTGPGGNAKTGQYNYGVDFEKLSVTVDKKNETCRLEDSNVKTIDLHGAYVSKEKQSFEFKCFEQNGDAINGAFSPLNDAHFFGDVVFNMYKDWYDTAPLLFQLKLSVHYGNEYENAFWDGDGMTFGDGADYFYPLVGLDVVAHEVSHGFTEQNSGLQYDGQSGGINEAFSDMAGKAAEFYMHHSNTWGIGEEITKGSEPLRYMDHPESDGMSIGDASDFTPYLDVHYSSGVFNKAFYLLANSHNWDTKKAFDVVVYANANYWTSNSDFSDAAWGVIQAAQDLDYNQEDVKLAFHGVGIDCNNVACEIKQS